MSNLRSRVNEVDRIEPMETCLFNSFEDAEDLKEEWDRFIEENSAEIFLTFDWCRIWWKHYGHGRDLLLFIFRVGNEIVGILPLMREKIGYSIFSVEVVRFVGTDFSPITIGFPVKSSIINQVISCLIGELNRKCKWDLLHIGPICGRSKHQEELKWAIDQIPHKDYRGKYFTNGVQTYHFLEDSWDRQLKNIKKRQRSGMRNAYTGLQAKGLTPNSTFATKDNYERRFEEFVQMHQAHWRIKKMPGHFVDWPRSYDFHKEFAGNAVHQDRLRLLQIQIGNLCIGYEYILKFGDTYYSYLDGRIKYLDGLGISHYGIAFRETVEKGIREQVKTLDSMRGRYNYKLQVGGKMFPIFDGLIQSRDSLTRWKVTVFQSLAWALNVLYMKIWRRRMARWLCLNSRPLWNIWIRTYAYSNVWAQAGNKRTE